VVEIGAGQDADRLRLRVHHISNRAADFLAHLVSRSAEADRDERKLSQKTLEERQLDLERVLACMGGVVLAEKSGLRDERVREDAVDRDFSKRGTPRSLAVYGRKVPEPCVIGAENDETLRERCRSIERRGHMTAVHQPCMRNHTADERLPLRRSGILGETGVDLGRKPRRFRFIEAAGDGGMADGHGQILGLRR
jgi:hypothetical protein